MGKIILLIFFTTVQIDFSKFLSLITRCGIIAFGDMKETQIHRPVDCVKAMLQYICRSFKKRINTIVQRRGRHHKSSNTADLLKGVKKFEKKFQNMWKIEDGACDYLLPSMTSLTVISSPAQINSNNNDEQLLSNNSLCEQFLSPQQQQQQQFLYVQEEEEQQQSAILDGHTKGRGRQLLARLLDNNDGIGNTNIESHQLQNINNGEYNRNYGDGRQNYSNRQQQQQQQEEFNKYLNDGSNYNCNSQYNKLNINKDKITNHQSSPKFSSKNNNSTANISPTNKNKPRIVAESESLNSPKKDELLLSRTLPASRQQNKNKNQRGHVRQSSSLSPSKMSRGNRKNLNNNNNEKENTNAYIEEKSSNNTNRKSRGKSGGSDMSSLSSLGASSLISNGTNNNVGNNDDRNINITKKAVINKANTKTSLQNNNGESNPQINTPPITPTGDHLNKLSNFQLQQRNDGEKQQQNNGHQTNLNNKQQSNEKDSQQQQGIKQNISPQSINSPTNSSDSSVLSSEIRHFLLKGDIFLKHGRQGQPHRRYIWCDEKFDEIFWRALSGGKSRHKKKNSSILIKNIIRIDIGKKSQVFNRRKANDANESLCFSLVTKRRTLDLEADCQESRNVWINAFTALIDSHAYRSSQGKL